MINHASSMREKEKVSERVEKNKKSIVLGRKRLKGFKVCMF